MRRLLDHVTKSLERQTTRGRFMGALGKAALFASAAAAGAAQVATIGPSVRTAYAAPKCCPGTYACPGTGLQCAAGTHTDASSYTTCNTYVGGFPVTYGCYDCISSSGCYVCSIYTTLT